MLLLAVIFLTSTAILIGTYPVSLLLIRLLPPHRCPHPPAKELPFFCIVVAAYNEEGVIPQKLANFQQIDYPPERLAMVVVSDHSTDGTDELVKASGDPRIRLLRYEERLGKVQILNRTIPGIPADIIINTDANVVFDRNTIRNFARWFQDSQTGLVCGYEEREVPRAGGTIRGETTYRDFEVRIKSIQSHFGAVMGAHGGLYAIRRECWQELPRNSLSNDDLMTAMNVLRSGKKVYMDLEARATEITGTRISEEFKRRIRIGAGNYQVFWWHRWLLNPMRGWKSFFFWTHKLPRWFTPHLMALSFFTNLALAGEGEFFRACLLAQIVFYGLALLGAVADRLALDLRLLTAPYHFCSMNLAVLLGFLKWLKGIDSSIWTPSDRR